MEKLEMEGILMAKASLGSEAEHLEGRKQQMNQEYVGLKQLMESRAEAVADMGRRLERIREAIAELDRIIERGVNQ